MSKTRVVGVVVAAGLSLAGCASVSQARSDRAAVASAAAEAPVKVVYHFTQGVDEAGRGLGNIRNHLAADPQARIVVVGNRPGIDFMLAGATDKNGAPFDAAISELKARGVEFRLCRNTITSRKIDPSTINPEVSVIPSGVAEAARLQFREGYSYLRP
ncbi:MAG: DsrE family protein [Burkholderiaceae bacterium]